MMIENLKIWEEFADIDPQFTKAITGKQYKGTSPNPQYVIRCLTELFGPVGKGFGWRVLAEDFQPLGEKTLHWCRIEFWHTDRANTFEEYGQTIAAYPTNSGGFMVDEDAPKKSQTDAIVKAASHLGIAANIFLGRWDDQKYVAEVNAEYRAEERQKDPPFNPSAAADRIIAKLQRQATAADLDAAFAEERDARGAVKDASPSDYDRILAAAKARKSELSQKDAA
jgi:hypothetical protein